MEITNLGPDTEFKNKSVYDEYLLQEKDGAKILLGVKDPDHFSAGFTGLSDGGVAHMVIWDENRKSGRFVEIVVPKENRRELRKDYETGDLANVISEKLLKPTGPDIKDGQMSSVLDSLMNTAASEIVKDPRMFLQGITLKIEDEESFCEGSRLQRLDEQISA